MEVRVEIENELYKANKGGKVKYTLCLFQKRTL